MSGYYCTICDKAIKLKYKTKYLDTKSHRALSTSVFNTYFIKNPQVFEIEDILKIYVNIYKKYFEVHLIICKWKLQFTNTIIHVKYEKLYNIHHGWELRRYLITNIECYSRRGFKFSQISEMNITFKTHLTNMTYEHYLKQPKAMIEWLINKELARNPELIKTLRNTSHPPIRKYRHIIHDEDEDDI